ncbi:MAG: type 1 glutamine amidotransferase-like domain-containing protein [Planctomycetaceae bacterium]|nr:type 1 glutamine amidotransferase-like domain-containing protein [Planctomycetaceae bacterium]
MKKTAVEPTPQIIAFGGCGAADPWVDPRIFRYVLHATQVSRPRIALLTCASGDDQRVLAKLHRLYRRMGAVTQQLKLGKGQEWHRPGLLSQHFDLIHVEGGNTGFLMHQLQQNSMRSALHEAWLNGVVLTGTSAGASCWFAHAMSASLFSFVEEDETIVAQPGLGFLPHSICVHYDRSERRREAYKTVLADGLQAGFGLDHHAGLHFHGGELTRVIALRPNAGAFEVTKQAHRIIMNRLEGESPEQLAWNAILNKVVNTLIRRLRKKIPLILQPKAH